MLEMGMAIDYGQMVIDNEFSAIIKNAVGGIKINDEELTVDIIHEIGPMNDFLSHESTLKHARVHSYPDFIDRRTRVSWNEAGCPSIHHKAMEHAIKIMEKHEPDPLPKSILNTMNSIIEEAEEELGILRNRTRTL